MFRFAWLRINQNNAIQGANCMLETLCRETIVFGSHDPTYDTTSDWLGQGKLNITQYREPTVFRKRHTGRPFFVFPLYAKVNLTASPQYTKT